MKLPEVPVVVVEDPFLVYHDAARGQCLKTGVPAPLEMDALAAFPVVLDGSNEGLIAYLYAGTTAPPIKNLVWADITQVINGGSAPKLADAFSVSDGLWSNLADAFP